MVVLAWRSRTLKPGDNVLTSGVFRVIHRQHREPHDVIAIRGEELPPCRSCAGNVRYELIQTLSHVTEDWDLAGLTEQLLKELPYVSVPKRRAA